MRICDLVQKYYVSVKTNVVDNSLFFLPDNDVAVLPVTSFDFFSNIKISVSVQLKYTLRYCYQRIFLLICDTY